MNDDLLSQYVHPVDEPEPHEPSLIRSDAPRNRLELRELSGNSRSVPYAAIRLITFNPSAGIRLDFADTALSLGGLNLRRIFDALNDQAAKAILILGPDAEAAEGASVVTTLTLESVVPEE